MEPVSDSDVARAEPDDRPTDLEGLLAATLIEETYKAYLKRSAEPDEVTHWLQAMRNGLAPTDFVNSVKTSEEASLRFSEINVQDNRGSEEPIGHDLATLIDGLYRGFLGRSAQPEELGVWASAGISFVDIAREVRDSDEARGDIERTLAPRLDRESAKISVQLMYRVHLGRYPNDTECETWARALLDGRSLENCVEEITASPEAQSIKFTRSNPRGFYAGEFILKAYRAILNRSPTLLELHSIDRAFRLDGKTTESFLMELLDARELESYTSLKASPAPKIDIMGTMKKIDQLSWQRAVQASSATPTARVQTVRRLPFYGGRDVTVSVIVSLYKGRAFLERFFENLVTQTIFSSDCEVIIVDAASPEHEAEIIMPLLERHTNIRYIRTPERITIYKAWNIALADSRGRYITNMNIDDLRHPTSLETQASTLDALPFVDVVYQDFYYSFDPMADFETVAQTGVKSRLPPVTATTLFAFNSPHHAPMWRKGLHDDVGLFDDTLTSAGDYDFWCRCLRAGKTFFKIDEAHAAYLVNPNGVSSRGDPIVAQEIEQVRAKHAGSLLLPALLEPFELFGSQCHALSDAPTDRFSSRYDVVQTSLRVLGRRMLNLGAAS